MSRPEAAFLQAVRVFLGPYRRTSSGTLKAEAGYGGMSFEEAVSVCRALVKKGYLSEFPKGEFKLRN